ncbi:TOBE domain-containing protein [Phormidium sp. LEGE 05292]|uniref:TOBE domain-containing protein n=1 Tax=[Phormidium] sp. LEGE 05292 TaxID=767427 RepID=UPI00187F1787|nr:molybdopterin-binding protein [Phormidium sp. LEGE 05292]MBE9228858.1 TOBE domain-containing protein [Phormidium sp. LEGE 05292]
MPRKDQGWITFQSSEEERTLLEQYCQESQRSKTEVLRELLRGLTQQWQKISENSPSVPEVKSTVPSSYQVLGISARNTIPGKVKQVLIGDITAEVIVEIAPNVEIVSVITKSSVERFAIAPGKEVCVVIKSSDVMIAVEQ